MLKIHVPHSCNYKIRYRYTDNGSLRTGTAYFASAESVEKFCYRLHIMHPDATVI